MELKDGQQIAAPVEQVWAGLFDPDVLQRCLPGCESVTRESEHAYSSKLALKIGPVSARFSGRVEMQDVEAPRRCKLVFQGAGGAAGFARGEAQLSLEPRDGGTYLEYDAAVNVGGKLAQIGARLVDSTAKKLAGEFFERFREVFEAKAPEDASASSENLPVKGGHDVAATGVEMAGSSTMNAEGLSATTLSSVSREGQARQLAAARKATASASPLTQLWRSRALWLVVGAGISSAINYEWVDQRAGWFILGAALSYLLTQISGKDNG